MALAPCACALPAYLSEPTLLGATATSGTRSVSCCPPVGNYFLYLALAQDLLSGLFLFDAMYFHSAEEPPENDGDSSS